jgi:hypothetical protein
MRRLTILALVLAAVLTACGGSDSNNDGSSAATDTATTKTKTTTWTAKEMRDPVSCLKQAGLPGVEQTTANLWRGAIPLTGLVIRVEKFPSKGEALAAVADADRVAAYYGGGRYGVFGPLKNRDDGSTERVAACLRGD